MIAAIANLFGAIIRVIYNLVGNDYAISIIIFTIFTKLVLLPLYIKQVKSSEEMNKITPLTKQIQEKYKKDKQKMSEELTKLYSEHKINPLGGCLPVLIQIPIVLAMFYIVKQPLTYIVQTPQVQIEQYTKQLVNKEEVTKAEINNNQIEVANQFNIIDMQLGPFNLGDIPSNVFSKDESKKVPPISVVIPILSVVVSIVQIKLMQRNSSMTEEQKEMQKSTNIMLPMFSGIISYTMPLALGFYWLIGGIIQLVQQFVIMEIIKKDTKEYNLKLKGGILDEKSK